MHENIINRIRAVEKDDAEYPVMLRDIKDAPEKLYYMGNLSVLNEKTVAVVGSRRATPYGLWAAEEMGKKLAACGITVVSGLARGVDFCAHKGAMIAGGKTVAVMGNGIDECSPVIHKDLWKKIIDEGLVISEYPPGVPGSKFTYPKRNRIISGLSVATVVIEAGLKSGSLITAELAAEQGRSVYALPGNINSVNSFGSNQLIKDGAIPLTVFDDILVDLKADIRDIVSDETDLSDDEKRVFGVIKQSGETSLDEICCRTGFAPAYISGVVTVLEMKGKVCMSMGKVFVNMA